MKRFYYMLFLSVTLLACSKQNEVGGDKDTETYTPCGIYKSGQKLYKGSKGGCFYYNSKGNKEYVERSACKC
ncbi:hypothetical protein [Pedobacter sp.]|uniref:hypothetical protein n=1 Tax=Pedobacter sp. TaxID=1411316 RepID=UPI0031DD3A1D